MEILFSHSLRRICRLLLLKAINLQDIVSRVLICHILRRRWVPQQCGTQMSYRERSCRQREIWERYGHNSLSLSFFLRTIFRLFAASCQSSIARLKNCILKYIDEATSSSVVRLAHFGATTAVMAGARVRTKLKTYSLTDLWALTS